jgi:hypothetical protein
VNDIAANPTQSVTIPSSGPATTAAPSASPIISVASTDLSTFNPIGTTDVAKLAKADVPTGARVAVTVDKSSKKICVVEGSTVVALSTGKCKVKVAVTTGKGKPKSKTTTITVKK